MILKCKDQNGVFAKKKKKKGKKEIKKNKKKKKREFKIAHYLSI